MRKEEIILESGRIIKVGDRVKIAGDIKHSMKAVYVSEKMRDDLFNNGKIYKVQAIDRKSKGPLKGQVVVRVENWWWSSENIFKVEIFKEKIEPVHFDIDDLVL